MHDMREICGGCGATYGEHRSVDAACPDDTTGRYGKVRFKLTAAKEEALREDLKKLLGLEPYNTPSNTSLRDSYFASSIENRYGATISDLRKLVGL